MSVIDKLKPDFPFPETLSRQAPQRLPLRRFLTVRSGERGLGFSLTIPSKDPEMIKKFSTTINPLMEESPHGKEIPKIPSHTIWKFGILLGITVLVGYYLSKK